MPELREFEKTTSDKYEILRCLVGSQAYGLSVDTSDEDYKGIYISPKENVIGVLREEETRPIGPEDHSYSLRHFARLATKCVPNVLELLFCEEENIVHMSIDGYNLRLMRDAFLSKNCIQPYIGYAQGQLKKAAIVPTNRGLGRQEMVAEFGYDAKFAMHTIRLLESARDLLEKGTLIVRRPNREFLLDIRFGRAFKNYDDFRNFALDLIENLRKIEDTTSLPEKPDMDFINRKIIDLHERYWSRPKYAVP